MHSLADLKSGRLAGLPRINIAEGLEQFPRELFDLADSVEILDLSGNRLNSLPDDFGRFRKLRILFLSDNCFQTFPKVLAQCPELSMVGFKANQIVDVPEDALPSKIRWLILTDNRIECLPESMGNHTQLQKVMLAGNRLTGLPESMANCINLELLRIAANRIEQLPDWLLKLPKLAWLAFAGNPCCKQNDIAHQLEEVHWDELQLSCQLGEGASGVISQAHWLGRGEVAMKEFKGAITSDGLPADEMAASIAAGQHKHLVEVLAKLKGHPEEKNGLLLKLVDKEFNNLAGPPSLESCTRDTYPVDKRFRLQDVLNIAEGIASVAAHLHERGIMHGDLYGHNILVNQAADCLFGDFGAASMYERDSDASVFEQLEVRALGSLLEELLERLDGGDRVAYSDLVGTLEELQRNCVSVVVRNRPGFSKICKCIQDIDFFN